MNALRSALSSLCLTFIYLATPPLFSQAAMPEQGAVPFRSYSGGDFDHVELQNGNLFIKIPIVSFPQLGKLTMSFSLLFNGSAQTQEGDCYEDGSCYFSLQSAPDASNTCPAPLNGAFALVLDQTLSLCRAAHFYTNLATMQNPNGGSGQIPAGGDLEGWNSFGLIDSTGNLHPMLPDASDLRVLRAADGSGYSAQIPNSEITPLAPFPAAGAGSSYPIEKIIEANGTVHISQAFYEDTVLTGIYDAITDANQNQISTYTSLISQTTKWTDSTGVEVSGPTQATVLAGCPTIVGAPAAVSAYDWSVPGPNGQHVTYKFCYGPVAVATNFFGFGAGKTTHFISPYANNYPDGIPIWWLYENSGVGLGLQSLVLPNGTFWGFTYDSVTPTHTEAYGDLTDVFLPTGGTIHYDYATIPACGHATQNISAFQKRAVIRRTLKSGSSPDAVTEYAYHPADTIVKELHNNTWNETKHVYTLDYPGVGCGAVETSTKIYEGVADDSKTPLRETTTSYMPGFQNIAEATFPAFGQISVYAQIVNRFPSTTTTKQNGVVVSSSSTAYRPWGTLSQPYYMVGAQPNSAIWSTIPNQHPWLYLAQPASVNNGVSNVLTTYYDEAHPLYKAANIVNLLATVKTFDPDADPGSAAPASSASFEYDESPSPSLRGNLTKTIKKGSSLGDVVSTSVYSETGMPTDTYDANYNGLGAAYGDHSHITYSSSGLFPVAVERSQTNGYAHKEYFSYDTSTGYMISHTDQNGSSSSDTAHTTYFSYDNMGRMISATSPAVSATAYGPGGQSVRTYCYVDHLQPSSCSGSTDNTLYISVSAAPNPSVTSAVSFDSLGRKWRTVGADGAISDTTYDDRGDVLSVTNPHLSATSSPTDGIVSFEYDPLRRKTKQTNPDGSSYLHWDYLANTSTSYDELNRAHKGQVDLGGRLTSVWEQDPNGPTLSLETAYSYDPMGNLHTVHQIGASGDIPRDRVFTYDSLSRLTLSENKEAGDVSYTYDPNGNVKTKTDARGAVVTYSYDQIGRVVSKVYTDPPLPLGTLQAGVTNTPSECYSYDSAPNGKGKLAAQWTQYGTTCNQAQAITQTLMASYDPTGHLTEKRSCVLTNCTTQSFTPVAFDYDLAGNVIRYGSGGSGLGAFSIYQSFDSSARLKQVFSDWGATGGAGAPGPLQSIWSVNTFNPGGSPSQITLGSGTVIDKTYDDRLRVTGSQAH